MQVNNFAIANSCSISVELTVLSNNYCKEVEVFLPSLSVVFTDCKYFITAIIGGKEKPEDFKKVDCLYGIAVAQITLSFCSQYFATR